ncbi:hypothetical protein RFI_14094 [Reticulomyxa filosa]|uniref:Uncharacterized protein n=1 Tax=Reticulomyxa filosa TaxID=46433 RepID=X6NCP2_RETFI|nr:hypothetical protein RFI_14094 [Reticulomyxa filosa]|eukprot:ETO23092.1 hypothetical protein RFI_14094 [Reticulomyxa filosa]
MYVMRKKKGIDIPLESRQETLIKLISKLTVLCLISSLPMLLYALYIIFYWILVDVDVINHRSQKTTVDSFDYNMYIFWLFLCPLDNIISSITLYLNFKFSEAHYSKCCKLCDLSCQYCCVLCAKRSLKKKIIGQIRREYAEESKLSLIRESHSSGSIQ